MLEIFRKNMKFSGQFFRVTSLDDIKCDISYKRCRWRRKEDHSVIFSLAKWT